MDKRHPVPIGNGCLFSTFIAFPKSSLCRLDQTKSLQSIHTLQQTFSPRFETLTMQVGLEKHKNMEKVDPLYTCYGFGRENTDQSVIYRHNVPQTEGKACPHAGLAQDRSSLAYNNEQNGSKGPNDGPEGVQTLHWYRVSVFPLFCSHEVVPVPIGSSQGSTKHTHSTANVCAQISDPANANRP